MAAGQSEASVASELNVNRKTVRLWRERFRATGPQGLWEIAPGRGRKPTYSSERIQKLIDATFQANRREALTGVAVS